MKRRQSLDINEQFMKAYDAYADAIFRYCYIRVSDRDRALDICQDAFTKTWDYLISSKPRIENMRAFLYKTAHNLIIDEYRKKKTSSLDELHEKGFDPAIDEKDKIHAMIALREFQNILNSMDEPTRNILSLRFVDDMSVKNIANIVSESENAVSVKLHRALKLIRNMDNK